MHRRRPYRYLYPSEENTMELVVKNLVSDGAIDEMAVAGTNRMGITFKCNGFICGACPFSNPTTICINEDIQNILSTMERNNDAIDK